MERFTQRSFSGKNIILKSHVNDIDRIKNGRTIKFVYGKPIDKLASYEDAEENNLLEILPCKLGDIPYWICNESIYCKDNSKKAELSIQEDSPITGIAVKEDGFYIEVDDSGEFYKIGSKNALLTMDDAKHKLEEIKKELELGKEWIDIQ